MRRRGISRTVVTLGIVSLLTDISSEGVYPLIPLFLTGVLGANAEVVGLIEGIAESTASLLRVFSGWLSDKLGRRKWVTTSGYALSAFSKPLLALVGSWQQVLGVRFADRLGKGIRSAPRDALIADVTPQESRGIAFGFHRAMDTTGALAGPLIAYFLLRYLHAGSNPVAGEPSEHAYRVVFALAAIPAILGVILLAAAVREPKEEKKAPGPSPSLHWKALNRPLRMFLLVATLFSIGNSSDAFIILRAKDAGIQAAHILILYIIFNGVGALLSTWTGALSDRLGRRQVILAGYLVFAVVYAGFGLAKTPAHIWMLFGLYGVYQALTEGVQRAFAADLAEESVRGTGLGAYHTLTGLALLPASVIAGFLWTKIGPPAPFFYGAATAVAAAALLVTFFRGGSTYSDTSRGRD